METVNSLFSQNSLNSLWAAFKKASLLALMLVFISGCGTLRTRDRSAAPTKKEGTSQQTVATEDGPEVEIREEVPRTEDPSLPQPPATPSFLNKQLPKVGIILGPGGMKAFAHIGVLREISKAKIPVHAVTGLEWGAVMGALYAHQGQANEAEWQSFKLKETDLPEGSLLSAKLEAAPIGQLQTFLETAFPQNLNIEKMKVTFACPAYWSKLDRFGWMQKGQTREAMRACVPYPPLYKGAGGVHAAPFSVDAASAWLRSRGAELIILVNVLGRGEFLPSKTAASQPSDDLLWSEIRRVIMAAKSPLVHYTINVDTSGHPVTDFDGRRAIMENGAKSAADQVKKIAAKHGF